MDNNSLAHSKWNCKYHIVFAPKYRRQVIYGKIKADIGRILRELCEHKKVEIIEANACKDHIHMLVSIPPKLSVAQFMGYLKGKSSLMIFDRHANLKYRYGNRQFWCKGYYVDTVGRNKKVIEEYIKNQIQEDICRKLISKFSAISVREDSGIKICRDYFHVNAQLVVDPTLLLTLEEYKELVNYTSSGFDNSLSCYLLDKTINKEDVVEYVSRVKGLIPVYVNTETENSFAELGKQIAPSIESWIGGFIRAEFVVTDSFHAMLFSVLFNKPFIVIGNRKRGIIRFISFLNSIGLEERLVSDTSSITLELINKSVDWELVNNKIFSLRRKSINFLMAALK